MAGFGKQFSPRKTLFFLTKILLRKLGFFSSSPESKLPTNLQKHTSLLLQKPPNGLSEKPVVFDMEGSLLKSQSLFPYFMLVAFEAGGLFRALILLLFYPFVSVLGEDNLGLKVMIFVSFFGIRKDQFRAGTSVLPKFFLEDVGLEGFEGVMKFEKKIGVSSKLPRIMVEGFLRDYMGVESVIGRELRVVCGYFVGLMEGEVKVFDSLRMIKEIGSSSSSIGIGCSSNTSLLWQLLQECKEVYPVTESEKRNWKILDKSRYPKPVIFHDCRLAFRPTPSATTAMFMWLPFGFILSMIRMTTGILLPFKFTIFFHALTGAQIVISKPKRIKTPPENPTGVLFACNHRTLLDPIYISFALMRPVAAVTYSMSRFNEVISPIRTVRLVRDRETDRQQMNKMLRQGDVVICPEGTTCREPFLLRFSPLFAEITDEIVPVAIDVKVTMFYGSTASGFKCLDPIFHLLNPRSSYVVKILEKLPAAKREMSKYDVANTVQKKIGKTLGFECSKLTRKDKYIMLAGNEGIV
ncbi:probable glycerol-3-phosphate acyltransferase 3 [Euphorbia lathyris]|uniref:probable glycerol-3-phosphate acyltransferase 3 n=1 Tax=Euphorbia lathyris TaxID=212925 RepID=UPI0033144334